MKDFKTITIIALSIIIVILLTQRACNNNASVINSYENDLDTLRNKLNQQEARNHLIVDAYNSIKAVARAKDSSLVDLQKIIDSKTSSATILQTRTQSTVTGKPTVLDSNGEIVEMQSNCPTYILNRGSDEDTVSVEASCGKVTFTYTAYNIFQIKQYWKRKGIFKKENFVEVTNLNPHTQTTGLRSFKVNSSQSRLSLGISISAGISSQLQPGIFIGAGLHYSIISF